jgi:hypothetical protein
VSRRGGLVALSEWDTGLIQRMEDLQLVSVYGRMVVGECFFKSVMARGSTIGKVRAPKK